MNVSLKLFSSLVCALIASVAVADRTVLSLSGPGWTLDGEPVSVPHTWNAEDGCDGGKNPSGTRSSCGAVGSYVRKAATYRRTLPAPTRGRRQFIRCHGASIKATVSVNGREVGRHAGAFTAFAFEVTDFLKPTGNVLAIRVDNTFDPSVPPISGDFTMYGGLYRDVEWIETDPVCIDPVTDGADGVVLDADPKTGTVVAQVRVLGGTNEIQRFRFANPRLWSPESPELHSVTVRVTQGGSSDAVTVPFGFRAVDLSTDGFRLNGVRRRLRGVCCHQDREGRGWAVSPADERSDVALMKKMGCDAVRTSHYPRSRDFLDACDRQGLMVWCEVSFVDDATLTDAFRSNLLVQVREMVAQRRNHPSVVLWGAFNELYNESDLPPGSMEPLVKDVRDLLHALDPSRKVVCASNQYGRKELNVIADFCAFNVYPGWYDVLPWYRRNIGCDGEEMANLLATLCETNGLPIIGIGEYGAGGSVWHHANPFDRTSFDANRDAEEYQAYFHCANYRAIAANDRVWGSFAWEMFDSGADFRNDPGRLGCNTKGLVEFDHKTPKDAFYFYQANWSREPTLHLVGSRMKTVTNAVLGVMAFSNVGRVELTVNGRSVGVCEPDCVKSCIWRDVRLEPGLNRVSIAAGGRRCEAEWTVVSGMGRDSSEIPVGDIGAIGRWWGKDRPANWRDWAERLHEFRSSLDGTPQLCYFWKPETSAAVPLIVGLHTWSCDWRQLAHYETVLKYAQDNGWAFVGPNFRGPNNHPEACGGEAAVQDIVDAVRFAQGRAKIDAKRIYIIGGSGGGHMTLLMLGRHPEIFAAGAAFCPITDLARWHADSLADHPGRGREYARMLEKACGGSPDVRAADYAVRSPLTWLPRIRTEDVKAYICTGIHDGWKGSVPVGHSFRAFNALCAPSDAVAETDIAEIERTQQVPDGLVSEKADDPFYDRERRVHFRRTSGNVRLVLFEGGHAGNFPAGLDFLSRQAKGRPVDWTLPTAAKGSAEQLSR